MSRQCLIAKNIIDHDCGACLMDGIHEKGTVVIDGLHTVHDVGNKFMELGALQLFEWLI